MHSDIQKSLQRLLDKYPQHKEEKALYDALKELLEKARKEDEEFECKAENIGTVVVNNITNFFEVKENTQSIHTGFLEFDRTFGGFSKGEYTSING
ncbi:MAG: hypothetical protein IPO21_19195 [Bacteroidales bacterium]|nr:hypothetical protein [Bacteroidales bacterium]